MQNQYSNNYRNIIVNGNIYKCIRVYILEIRGLVTKETHTFMEYNKNIIPSILNQEE